MTETDLHTKLNQLAANIKDAEKAYENAYHEWVMAGNSLRRLERQHRKIWLDLFERPRTDFSKLRPMTPTEVAEVERNTLQADAETIERRLTRT
jgi:hypothetical protein